MFIQTCETSKIILKAFKNFGELIKSPHAASVLVGNDYERKINYDWLNFSLAS